MTVPALFSRVPGPLFGPLAGGHAALYWSLLATFYHYEFEREPFYLVRGVVLDTAEDLLRGSPSWSERREELLTIEASGETEAEPAGDEAALLRATARRLVARLEVAGWFHFEYRSAIGEVLSFYPYAARILEALVRVARDEQPMFQGYAHSIASLLRPDVFAARPGVSLSEARRNTVDNLYKWRGEILHRLDAIEADPRALEAAARWYGEQFGLDATGAADAVAADLRLLRAQFETLPRLVDDIDTRNARFSGVALRKLMYLLRQDTRTEGQLQRIVDALARDRAPELVFDVYKCELLAEGFLHTPPRRRPRAAPQPLARRAADSRDLRREIAPPLHRPFARSRVEAFVEGLLGGREAAPLSAAAPESDSDYVRLIYTVAYGLDARSPYRFDIETDASDDGQDHYGPYGFPRGALTRRPKR